MLGLELQDLDNRVGVLEPRVLPIDGIDGEVLGYDGGPTWVTGPPKGSNTGEIIYWDETLQSGSGGWAYLAIGDEKDVLTVSSQDIPSWAASSNNVADGTADNQMLYWDSTTTKWVASATPSTPGSGEYISLKLSSGGSFTWKDDLVFGANNEGDVLAWNDSDKQFQPQLGASPAEGDMLRYESGAWAALAVTEEELLYDGKVYTFLSTGIV